MHACVHPHAHTWEHVPTPRASSSGAGGHGLQGRAWGESGWEQSSDLVLWGPCHTVPSAPSPGATTPPMLEHLERIRAAPERSIASMGSRAKCFQVPPAGLSPSWGDIVPGTGSWVMGAVGGGRGMVNPAGPWLGDSHCWWGAKRLCRAVAIGVASASPVP